MPRKSTNVPGQYTSLTKLSPDLEPETITLADRAVSSVILAVEFDSRSRTLGCNEPLNNERQGRADGHDKNDAVEYLGVDVAVEEARGDKSHDGHG